VYTRESQPLVGIWRQSGWKLCKPVAQLPASSVDPTIQELLFRADGSFAVTWMPFETYKDYWGRYRYDRNGGAIELMIERGNFVPNDFAGHGTVRVTADTLTLHDVHLGTKRATARPPVCELTFVRSR
jgi:hypothetical protein